MNGLFLTKASLSNMESLSHSLSRSVISILFNGKQSFHILKNALPV